MPICASVCPYACVLGKNQALVSLNKLPSTRVFIAAEKWTVRSTGVGGFFPPKKRTSRC